MHELNPYLRIPYLLPGLFTAAECAQIIESAVREPVIIDPYAQQRSAEELGATGDRRLLRDQGVASWVLQRLMQSAFGINQQHYRFEIQGMEVPHVIEYRPGQQSFWHMDITDDQTTNRKLSMLVFLSDPDQFKGGRFSVHPEKLAIDQAQGNVLLFPAYMLHKVEPVLEGVRWSMATWGVGPPFR